MDKEEKLSGEVELNEYDDECHIGKQQKGKPSRSAGGKFVIIGIKQRSGEVRASVIKDVSSRSVKSFIKDEIAKSSQVYTDGFRSYNNLEKMEYTHHVVNHNKEFVRKDNVKIHTNSIENVWKQIRRIFSAYNGVRVNCTLFLDYAIFRLNYLGVASQKKLLRKWRMVA